MLFICKSDLDSLVTTLFWNGYQVSARSYFCGVTAT